MKKYMRKIVLVIVVIAITLMYSCTVFAASVTIGSVRSANLEGKKIRKVYPGEEFYVVFKVDGDNKEDVKAVYGTIEYDNDILEVVEEENNPVVGVGWMATPIDKNDSRFFFHTQKESPSDTLGYLKMRAKTNIGDASKCTVSIKDVTLYKENGVNSFGELTHEKYNADLNIKIGDKTEDLRNIIVLVVSIVVLAIIVIFVIVGKKKNNGEDKSVKLEDVVLDDDDILDKEESLVMDSKDNRAEIQAKMRAVLDEVKKNKAEKEKKEEENKAEVKEEEKNEVDEADDKESNAEEDVNEASNTDEEDE